MDGIELLRQWPTWRQANAARLLASPAWRLDVHYAGERGELRILPSAEADDIVWLVVKFDAAEHVLGIVDNASCADLHALWHLRDRLPKEVLLALVEKECGGLFQMLEDVFRRQFAVVGLAEKGPAARLRRFELSFPESGAPAVGFLLNLSPAMEIDIGRFENIDVRHDSIRGMTREVDVLQGVCTLAAEEIAALAPGDHLLLPEDAAPAWRLSDGDAGLGVVSETPGTLTFAEMMDDALPPPPPSENLRIVLRGRTLAHARFGRLGSVRAAVLSSLASD